MRFALLVSVGILGCTALTFAAKAAPALERQMVGAGNGLTQTVQACPRGYRYVAAGYDRHAKWRPAHCAPR